MWSNHQYFGHMREVAMYLLALSSARCAFGKESRLGASYLVVPMRALSD